MALIAVEREMLLGKTRKELLPGMIRRPKRSPRLDGIVNIRIQKEEEFNKTYESKMWFWASAAALRAHWRSGLDSSTMSPLQKRHTTEASRSSTKDPGVRSVNWLGGSVYHSLMKRCVGRT